MNDDIDTAPMEHRPPNEPDGTRRSRTHRVDPISAVLGIAAIGAGIVVIAGAVEPLASDDVGIVVAAVGVAFGLALIPWGRRRSSGDEATALEA